MKLSKLYSNQPDLFRPIEFNPGLNVVLAEIRLPENLNRDTHNLGKTTVGTLIDYCLLSGRDNTMFLYKHAQRFRSFVFYLEVALRDGSYLTIRRGVENATKICFKRHLGSGQDYSSLKPELWDHVDIAFDRARDILDGLLNLTGFSPWAYRKGLGYFLRSQDDYGDVFQLNRFAAAHADWKPFIVHMLGFDGRLVDSFYKEESKVEVLVTQQQVIHRELGGSAEDLSKVEGMLLLKEKQAADRQQLLDGFDFRKNDRDATKRLVDEVDEQIAALNGERYSLTHNRKRVVSSLDEGRMMFDPDDAAALFAEAGIYFAGQLKRDYEQLIEFNKAITDERRQYLLEEKETIDARLREVSTELNKLGKQRSASLAYLTESDVVDKYKHASQELVQIQADVLALKRQKEHLRSLQRLRDEIRTASEIVERLEIALEREFEQKNDAHSEGVYTDMRVEFDAIVKAVLDQNAILTVQLNKAHHPTFDAQILDQSGRETSAQRGHTYKKLLCIAFDLALLRTHVDAGFPSFAFHDGVFESLDRRKKTNLMGVLRENVSAGLQQIITLIDTDLPPSDDGAPVFDEGEIIIRLHDEGEDGRLFRMASW
ncbi:DUF2326 domain-containing protein [Agromyces aureus]|uniref:DUF2326 domain-containing protein n=1 Tax=Agromyces aureus TaxID=453304 RepID=A0A191WC63_9MICO|nr:DUF2326 domain-containing protein [Agromyces aureus]ANJ25783.1 hypothetical protein ATC03_02415 [Agromyces aureus]